MGPPPGAGQAGKARRPIVPEPFRAPAKRLRYIARPLPPRVDWERAADLIRAHRYRQALPLYEEAVRENPGDERGYCGAVIALMETRKRKEAAAYLERLMKLRPEEAYPLGVMGCVMENGGRKDEAMAWYQKMIELDPQETLARLRQAQMTMRDKEKQYEKHLVDAIKLKTTRASAVEDQARLVAFIDEKYRGGKEGMMPGVLKMRRMLRCGPPEDRKDPDLLLERAGSLAAGGMLEEAAEAAGEAASVDPDFATAHGVRGEMLAELGRYGEAAACIGEAVRIMPYDAKNLMLKGMLLEKLGRFGEAAECYGRAIKADRMHMTARYLKCGALAHAGDAKGLAKCYREAIEAETDRDGASMQKQMLAEYSELQRCTGEAGSAAAGLAEFLKTTGVGIRTRWGRPGEDARPLHSFRRRPRGPARQGRLRAGRRA